MIEELWVGVELAGVDADDVDDADVEIAEVGEVDVAAELTEVEDVTEVLTMLKSDVVAEADVLADELAEVELWLVCDEERTNDGEVAAEEVVSLVAEEEVEDRIELESGDLEVVDVVASDEVADVVVDIVEAADDEVRLWVVVVEVLGLGQLRSLA